MDVTFASDLVTFDGTLVAIVWPDPADVRAGVKYGPSGTELTGTLIVGSGSSATPEEIAAVKKKEEDEAAEKQAKADAEEAERKAQKAKEDKDAFDADVARQVAVLEAAKKIVDSKK